MSILYNGGGKHNKTFIWIVLGVACALIWLWICAIGGWIPTFGV